jgi:hypothetical protein
LDRRLGGPQNRSGCGDEEKISQPLLRLEPPIIQLVSQRYTTELSCPYGKIKCTVQEIPQLNRKIR